MSVYRRSDNKKWMIEFTFIHPDGRKEVVRKVSPVQTQRGAESFEHQLRQAMLDGTIKKSPTVEPPIFSEFAKEFIEN